MGYKANIDIALSFSTLKVCSVRQQGRIKFRICLFYTTLQGEGKNVIEEIQFCHPYSIIRKHPEHTNNPHIQNNMLSLGNFFPGKQNSFAFPTQQSQLDLQSDYYLSKPFKMIFQRENQPIMQTCCFRTYIDIQKYAQVDLKCQVQLLFCPNAVSQESAAFKIIGKCQCKVRKLFDISTYLPIVFDEFEGVVIEGIYQAALIDFRYQKEQVQKGITPSNFHQYLKNITNGCKQLFNLVNRLQTRNFYRYYRDLLEKELFTIQERHYDLLRVLGINCLQQFRILKVNPNSKIEAMIDHLYGYNTSKNSLGTQRSIAVSSKQSVSTSPDEVPYLNRGIIVRGDNNKQYLNSDKSKEQLSQQIVYDFLTIKAHIFKKWSDFLEFSTNYVAPIAERYKNNYNSLVKERLSGNVFSHRVNTHDWKKSVYKDSGKDYLKFAENDKKKMQKEEQLWKEAFLVENQSFFVKDAKNIKIFEQIYDVNHKIQNTKSQKILLRKSLDRNNPIVTPFSFESKLKRGLSQGQGVFENLFNPRKNTMPNLNSFRMQQQLQGIDLMLSSVTGNENDCVEDEDHFIILVHGFQASRQDFIVLKNCLEIRFKIKVFISTCNEGRTDDDIEIQGKRLALQLQKFLNDSNPSFNYKLSFLGHSMGGIIIRTALCYLENVQRHLHSYISLSTPHLGYLYEPSTHIQAGLWFIHTWHKATSIQQLCVRDKAQLRQSFLYKLSHSKSLNKFKNISLISSSQDKYVPYQSARIENNQAIIQQLHIENGQILKQMIQALLNNIQCKELSRIDVIFNIQQNNFDSMIGRTAHIRYLSDRQFIKVFCIVFDKFFR